ncbi:Hypothetical predicted protein, partial [Pelobates cultripes]
RVTHTRPTGQTPNKAPRFQSICGTEMLPHGIRGSSKRSGLEDMGNRAAIEQDILDDREPINFQLGGACNKHCK